MDGVWEAIEEAQVPVSHHIGESPPATPNEFNAVSIGMLQSVAPFRDAFGKYIFGGILDRHPGLADRVVRGRDQLGALGAPGRRAHRGVVPASRPTWTIQHEPTYYWDNHMCASFMVDPLGLALARPHRRRPGDVVHRLPAQREHVRLQQPVAGGGRRRGGRRSRRPPIVGGNIKRYLGLDD